MSTAEIFCIAWAGGAIVMLVVIGMTHPNFRSNNVGPDDVGIAILTSIVWPATLLILLPITAGRLHIYLERRRARREAFKARVEAEKQIIAAERLKSAALRPKTKRMMDLGKK